MFSTFVKFAALALVASGVAATPVAEQGYQGIAALEANADSKALDFNVGWVATNPNGGGSKGSINVGGIPSGCRIFIGGFNDAISSISVFQGFRCNFYIANNCQGNFVTVSNGATVNSLAGTGFDNTISSVACFAS